MDGADLEVLNGDFDGVFKYIKPLKGSQSMGLLVNKAFQSLIFNQLSYLNMQRNFYSVRG